MIRIDESEESVWTLAPGGWRQSVGRSNRDVQKVSNAEFGLSKCLIIIDSFLTRAGHSDFAHLEVITPEVGVHDSKVKVGALLPGVRIDVSHQRGQFVQGGVLPGVNLKLVGGHVAEHILRHGVVSSRRAEDTEQHRTGLENT